MIFYDFGKERIGLESFVGRWCFLIVYCEFLKLRRRRKFWNSF